VSGLPTALKGFVRGKMTPKTALLHHHKAPKPVQQIFEKVDSKKERNELNLYVSGYEDEEPATGGSPGGPETPAAGAPEASGIESQETAGEQA
jgi:hypothetical protein